MSPETTRTHGNYPGAALLQALNAAAASLQQSAHSEAEVFRAFKEQVIKLGLRGGLSLLDEKGEHLIVRAIAYPDQVVKRLTNLERLIGIKVEGYEFVVTQVEIYRQMIETGEAIFLPDTNDVITQLLPEVTRPLAGHVLKVFRSRPAIFAPLVTGGRVLGVMNVVGDSLTPDGVPAIVAFANHLGVALDNARLFAAVREAETQYRRLFETANDGILVIDPVTSHILSANRKAVEMTGYTETELLAMPITDLHPPQVATDTRHFLEIARNEGHSVFELTLARRDGQALVVQVSATIFEANNRTLMHCVLRDVTERKRAVEALKGSEERYKRLLTSVTDYIYTVKVVNGQAVETSHGPGCVAVTGYSTEEYDADPHLWYRMVYEEDRHAVTEQAARVLSGETASTLEHRIVHKDGSVRWVRNTPVPRYDESGCLVAYDGVIADITERKRVADALQESEQRFRSVVQTASDALITVNSQGNIIFWNTGAETIFGFSIDEVIDRPLTLIIPERLSKAHQNGLNWPDSIGKSNLIGKTVELAGQRKNGSDFPLELSLASWKSKQEIFFTLIIRDITERKRAGDEIRRRNRELALLNQVIAASAASLEPETILESVCRELALAFEVFPVAAALLNEKKTAAVVVAEHQAEGRPSMLNEIIPIRNNPAALFLFTRKAPLMATRAQSDRRLGTMHDLLRRSGIESLLILPIIIEEEVVGGLGLGASHPYQFSDEEISLAWRVAEQVAGALARARLDKAHRLLSQAIEQSAESVIITDADGTIRYVNPAFEHTSGYSRAEAVGQNPRILKSGKQSTSFYETLWATILAGKMWQGRFVNKKKDGSLYTDEATISPVRNENGDIINYVSVQRDVTRELQLEEQYQQAQKMEAIGRLTGGIAHDFNNLLTAINGFAELLQFQLPSDSRFQNMVGNILSSGQHAADLVRQLLAFSRKQLMEPKVLNLNTVVTEVDRMLRRIIGEHIELVTILTPDLWLVKIDPAQMEQVIVNLAVNARDAMPEGGQLTIRTANVVLDDDYAASHLEVRPGKHVLLSVTDTGIGMDEEVQVRIFEPFFTTKEQGKGTGLGLATVFGVVKQSDGHIWVDSSVGQGTTFKIYLPPTVEATVSSAQSDQTSDLPPGKETILLVEDELLVRELAARVLRQQGYKVLEAANGHEALHLAQKHSQEIDLLLTDVVMPQMSGKELADQLAAMYTHIKILFTSGYTNDEIVHHGVLDPKVMFIEKPFSPASLIRKVQEVLAK